jgi:hypothetical protein
MSSVINKLNQNTKIESKTGGIESKVRKIKKLIQASQQIMKHPKNRP